MLKINTGMSLDIKIRKAEPNDVNKVYDLICQLVEFKMNTEKFRQRYAQNLLNQDIYYWVLESNGQVAGFISMHIQDLLHHEGRVAEVQELCIDEKFRNMGFGKLLLEDAILEAKKLKCELIELSTSNTRIATHRFYEREGWDKSHLKFTRKLG